MYRPLFMSCLLVLASIAGCFGGDEDGDSPSGSSPNTTGAPDPENSYKVVIRNYTDEGAKGAPINVTWEVMPAIDDENATNQSVTVSHTAIHWGNQSVPNPYTGEEPGSTIPTTTTTPTDTSSAFAMAPMTSHTTPTSGTTAATSGSAVKPAQTGQYPNETKPQSGVAPAPYNESFTVNASGLIYIRAHAIIGNKSFWSDEYVVNITANATLPLGKQHIVTYGGTPNGPLSRATPSPLNIKAGDSVVWKNGDTAPALNQHTAKSTAGTPSFDTGAIAPNAQSKPVYFNVTGSWTYQCANHPQTMTGFTIVST